MVPSVTQAQTRTAACHGTLLALSVLERGQTRSDRFRFRLRLEAKAPDGAAAMDQLNRRLEQARSALGDLATGTLTIPAPRTYSVGGGSQGPRRQQASTSISGEVDRARYDRLIQVAGRLPGASLQGMTSLPSNQDENALADRLLDRALQQGKRRAERTAASLGLRRVTLLRIDQRRGGQIVPVAYAGTAARSFRPEEAPKPSQSLSLDLEYCLF